MIVNKDLLDQARATIDEIDAEMAELFVRRMQAVQTVAAYKKEQGMPIYDPVREAEVVKRNATRIEDAEMRSYYTPFISRCMELSRAYQQTIVKKNDDMGAAVLHVDLAENGYNILLARGIIHRAGEILNLDRRVLIVTDDGVPSEYARTVAAQCQSPVIVTVPQGEGSKSIAQLESLCKRMLEEGFTRTDCVVAVGGGVVGDLAGFAAASYMRGIDFYNIPTTMLAQVDSSIGGKVAIDLCGVKNIVGAFHQPKCVLIDPELLQTLPARQLASGVAEAIKMALTSDRELFEMFEDGRAEKELDTVILRSLMIKKAVVEQDERESGLRRILNFGHTLGHGIEAVQGLYHGECVALGMIPMCSREISERLSRVLARWNLPTTIAVDTEKILEIATHDKKCDGGEISIVWVSQVGTGEIKKMTLEAFQSTVRERLKQ